MWDLGYATTWQQAIANEDNLYMSSAPMDDFLEWRDWRLIEELHWYGWFIDYWMEGGNFHCGVEAIKFIGKGRLHVSHTVCFSFFVLK